MKRLIGIVIVATTISTPTFGQNNAPGYLFTGSSAAAAPARVYSRTVSRHLGEPTYAMSLRRNSYAGYPYNDNTGGGSPGYNEMLLNW